MKTKHIIVLRKNKISLPFCQTKSELHLTSIAHYMSASTTCKHVICNSVLKSMFFVTSLNCVESLHSFLILIHYYLEHEF